MEVRPFREVAERAQIVIQQGGTVFQQWNCAHCGVKQTMPDQNKFYTEGICEECGQLTDIVADGCNFMTVWAGKFKRNKHSHPKFDQILGILGFENKDYSDEAEVARTWINGTLDDDEGWFEGKSERFIRDVFNTWKGVC